MPHNLMLDILKRLEIGVYLFCRRQSISYPELKDLLEEQAISEYNHAQAFATLGNSKIHLPVQHLMNKEESLDWNRLTWGDGDWGEPVDGISTRFLSSRLFFKGLTASSYDLPNKLAFMHVLEESQTIFYGELIKVCSSDVKKILNQIVLDEKEHSEDLLRALQDIDPEWYGLIESWRSRQNLALLLLPVDLIFYFVTHVLRVALWVCLG
ncbi:MAG: hypothetical protein V7L31_21010 [Nostoc sp.]|uniref:hypothetical protein n=1 Tax=Nostoc sp. TaxID=1180 RepID=UPI002FF0DCEE